MIQQIGRQPRFSPSGLGRFGSCMSVRRPGKKGSVPELGLTEPRFFGTRGGEMETRHAPPTEPVRISRVPGRVPYIGQGNPGNTYYITHTIR